MGRRMNQYDSRFSRTTSEVEVKNSSPYHKHKLRTNWGEKNPKNSPEKLETAMHDDTETPENQGERKE